MGSIETRERHYPAEAVDVVCSSYEGQSITAIAYPRGLNYFRSLA